MTERDEQENKIFIEGKITDWESAPMLSGSSRAGQSFLVSTEMNGLVYPITILCFEAVLVIAGTKWQASALHLQGIHEEFSY